MKAINLIGSLLLIISCNSPEEKENKIQEIDSVGITKEQSITINQYWVRDESFKIDHYVERHKWDAIKTESGTRYFIYNHGTGIQVEKGMLVTLNFDIKLMDSDTAVVYDSKGIPETFLVEMDNVESGLHEAMKYLRVGDEAIIILPHYAAHGILGDMNKIPPLSSVIYNVHIIDAKVPN